MERAGTLLAAILLAVPAVSAAEPVTDQRPTVGSAIATPMQDLNLKKTDLPEVLVKAAANPYDTSTVADCAAIAREIVALDQALGADADAPEPAVAEKASAGATVLSLGVQALIPYRGVIRQISGANASDKALASAIQVGFARRGFLKGRAVEMNCPAPASPVGYIQRPELAAAPLYVVPAPDLPAAPLFDLSRPPQTERLTAAPDPAPAPARPPPG